MNIEDMEYYDITLFLAKNVMGPDIGETYTGVRIQSDPHKRCWDPQGNANDMLMVIEAMREKGWFVRYGQRQNLQWFVQFKNEPCRLSYAYADTAQRAVCLAAVKALQAIKE